MSESLPIKFGIIGCSRVAKKRFLPAVVSSKKARLRHIGSRNLVRAEEYAKEFGAEKAGFYEDVLNDEEVSAVYISTPPPLHFEWVIKAAEAGKHIICEKPAFLNLAEAKDALEICREKGVRIFENYAFLYHPQHAIVRNLSEKIGKIGFFDAHFTYPLPDAGDIRLKAELLGGVSYDSLGYPIVAAIFHLDSLPHKVLGKEEINKDLDIDVSAEVELFLSGGVKAKCRAAMGEEYSSFYKLYGETGSLEVCRAFSVNVDKPTNVILETKNVRKNIFVKPASQFLLAINDFCEGVFNSSYGNFEKDILTRAKVMEAVRRSMKR